MLTTWGHYLSSSDSELDKETIQKIGEHNLAQIESLIRATPGISASEAKGLIEKSTQFHQKVLGSR